MPGPNTTGKPKTTDYNLGRGIVYIADLDANERPKAWRDLGNAPEFTISVESETLDHRSSREGLKTIDLQLILSQDATISFTLDELNHENLANWFSGEKATHTNVSVAGFAEWEMVPAGTIVIARWYDIKNSSHARAYDVEAADLTVKTTNVTPVTLVKDTDYELDAEFGRIFLLSTSTVVATAITNGEGLDVTLAADATAAAVTEVRGLTKTSQRVALKFIGENPANADAATEVQFHKVNLKPEGDFALIGDEVTAMKFSAGAEKNATASPNSPTVTIRNVAAA